MVRKISFRIGLGILLLLVISMLAISACGSPSTPATSVPATTAAPATTAPKTTAAPATSVPATTAAPATSAPATTGAPALTTSGKKIEIRVPVGSMFYSGEGKPVVAEGFCDKVTAATNGQLTFNIMVGALPEANQYESIVKGAYDMCSNPIMFNTGRWPIADAMTMPDLGTSCAYPSKVFEEAYQTYLDLQKEFSDTHIISVWAATPGPPGISFVMVNTPVRTLEDFKGKKIGVYGEWGTKQMAALGAVPVAVPPFAIYESLQRKIVDGTGLDPEMLVSYNVRELVKYICDLNFQFVPFYLAMNKDTWNSLPADFQQIMEYYAKDLPNIADTYHGGIAKSAIATSKAENGIEEITYSAEELARFNAALVPVKQEYIRRLDAKGLDGKAIFDLFAKLEAKYAQ